ncbi:putative alcohol dehydrogenase [Camillea tinctor]|nr:putative alcohol dehydrogenase [Camillea tinctor]
MANIPHAAIITLDDGSLVGSHDHTILQCARGAVLVRVYAVALNPSDHKVPAVVRQAGLVAGSDFAGEIVEVGADANDALLLPKGGTSSFSLSRTPWKIGDHVCGAVLGANPDNPGRGAFALYVEADPLVLMRVPLDLDWATAAAVGGSCIGAVGLALFRDLGLNLTNFEGVADDRIRSMPGLGTSTPPSALSKEDLRRIVLVYGGSTACGTMAIQLLSLAGYIPITTCSPHNNSLVTSYGAVAVFDYNKVDSCAREIKAYTKGSLARVIDCIGTTQSAALCYAAIGRTGGHYVSLEKFPDSVAATRRVVRASWVMGPLMLGGKIDMGDYSLDADPSARHFARTWFTLVQSLLCSGRIKSHPVKLTLAAGDWMKAVISGLSTVKDGTMSGEKLVVVL